MYKQMPPKKGKRVARKGKAKRSGKPKVVASKAAKKAITAIVRQVNKKDAETKFIIQSPVSLGGSTLNTFTGFSSGITTSNECYKLIPTILQGSDSFQREGDAITPLSLTVKGRISLQDRLTASADIIVHLYFLTCKAVKSLVTAGKALQVVPTSRLLDNGTGSKVAFDGTCYTSMYPVNKEEFNVIKHLKIRLSKSSGIHNFVGLVPGSWDSIATTAPPSTYARDFSVKIPLPAKLTYSNTDPTTQSNDPSNYYPFMVAGWTFADASGDTASVSTTYVNIEAQSHLYFQDPQ